MPAAAAGDAHPQRRRGAPGTKLLAKDGWQVACLALDAATEGYAFDTVITSPADAPAAISAAQHQAPG